MTCGVWRHGPSRGRVIGVPEQMFSGKRLSARERREAHRRAQARARARAAAASSVANPAAAASQTTGVRPLVALAPVSAPPGAAAVPPAQAPTVVAPAVGRPLPARPAAGAAKPGLPAPAVGPFTGAVSGPALTPAPWLSGAHPPGAVPRGGSPFTRALDSVEGSALAWHTRLRGNWGRRASTIAVACGSVLALAGLSVGLAVGGPVLGHQGRPVVALAGAATLGVGALWGGKGWRSAARRGRWIMLVLTTLLGASFTVGTLTNPVVVDGQVFLSTSAEARSYRLMQDIRSDLLELAAADEYLTFDAAQAGAYYDAYPGLLDRMTELSNKYAILTESQDLPDERFSTVVEQTTSAAYWATRAVQSKIEIIEADSARSQADLDTRRASYAEALLSAGESLRTLSADLSLPLTQMGPTE